jgi:xanthine dehydrogenase accessory factor
MDGFDIFDRIADLRARGRPFCVATVVRTAEVTSARPGAKAAVTETGEVIGHLGGACVTRAVQKAAAEALTQGSPQVIRVKPKEKVVALRDADGTQVYKSGCPSGGTVELLIEPYAHAPMLCILGDTPIARSVAAHGALAGYRIALRDEVPFDGTCLRFEGTDLEVLDLAERDVIVVATQGQGDLACLKAALESAAGNVTMVSSRRKAAVLCKRLLEEGMCGERAGRLKAPAGLDIGAVEPGEIALSILAEVVMWRHRHRLAGAARTGLA